MIYITPSTPHPTHVAHGGSLSRRYRRNITAARDLAFPRRHGAHGASRNFMRPPGSGGVEYQDPNAKHAPRVYTGAGGSIDPISDGAV